MSYPKAAPIGPRMTARSTFLVVLAALSLGGCGDHDGMPLALDTFRCPEQGLCLYATGKKSLQGGYREGDEELKFDVLHRPYRGLAIGEIYPWCMRLVDHKNQQYYNHDNGHCPASWSRGDGLQRLGGDESYKAAFKRDDLARALQRVLSTAGAPSKRHVALEVLQDMVDTHVLSAASPGRSHDLVQRSKSHTRKLSTDNLASSNKLEVTKIASEESNFSGNEPQKKLFTELPQGLGDADELQQVLSNRMADPLQESKEEQDEDEWPLPPILSREFASQGGTGEFLTSSDALHNKIAAFSKGSKDGVPKKSPEAVIEEPGYEFKQTMVLYSQNVKSHLLWGKRTRKHHTASKIEVFKRPRGSNGPWIEVDHTLTANHGSSPLSPHMKPYDWCEDTPTTYGRTVWKGECHGSWGIGDKKHLCNDDTRLQIRNAYNIASNKRCEKLDHYHRPWCHKR